MLTQLDLKIFRLIHNYQQYDMAKILGMNASSYRNYERNPEKFPKDIYAKLEDMVDGLHYSWSKDK